MCEEIYKSICRLCLKHNANEKMTNLLDENSEDGINCYAKSVLAFANISIEKNDCLPTVMCQKCLFLLKQCIYFKLQAESSDKKLKLLISSRANSVPSERNLKEKVIEYSMFMQYFKNECAEETSRNIIRRNNVQETVSKDLKVSNENVDDMSFEEEKNHDFSEQDSPIECFIATSNHDELLDTLDSIIGTDKHMQNLHFKRRVKKKHLKLKLQARKRHISQPKLQKASDLICHICQRVLANRHTYDNHMQRHNGCRYICEKCGKGFPVSTELQIHLVSRHGSGPCLQCQHCSFKTARKFDLVEHERIHTGERPYTCEKCGLTFRRRGIWKKHLIYHMEKTVQCLQCPRKFYQRSEMLAHMNNVHERLYVYLCNKCGATYAKTATVRRHLTERHGIPKELQGKVIRINKAKDSGYE